ncbi:MAG TPA: response regulator transcription factor [Povalibacter sp.]|uniref:response regulator transcription factor n=1 Tax=Povalibacter sp. TaxID=1962978 RepID=UPI002C808DFD|nr:response regulator transcription factor [Povalibacter sp.]HMN45865.1 response regulator transcription factor [Povalibacter sp.]
MRPSVLLADDHAMVAEGLGRLIDDVGELIGKVGDGMQLIREALRLQPDIIVSDIAMPGMSGLDAMRQLRAEGSAARFIFLTVHAEFALAAEAMRGGASGYVLKHAAGEELLDAIRTVMDGRTYVTPLITRGLLSKLDERADPSPQDLTPRQIEVLRLIAQGKRMKEIAHDLHLSIRTVEDHKYHLMQTLQLENNAELVRFALRQNLVPE